MLPAPFIDLLDDRELTDYRKGYRSFRKGQARCPGELNFIPGDSPVKEAPNMPSSVSSMRKVPSCKSMNWLHALRVEVPCGEEGLEPHLACSPFRLCPEQRPNFKSVSATSLAESSSSGEGIDTPEPTPATTRQLGESAARTQAKATGATAAAATHAPPQSAPAPAASGLAKATMAFVAVWYWTGAFTNSSSKQALAALPTSLPLTLTLVQHSFAAVLGTVAYRVLGLRAYRPLPATAEVGPSATRSLAVLCLVYTLGFALTNASFGAVNASFVDTVKAGEPITTVLLAFVFLANERMTWPVLLSLLPIVGGVAISSMAEASASALGLAYALGANVCFSSRSIAAKLVGKHMAGRMDGANLFVHVNRLGVLVLIPAVLALEGPALRDVVHTFPRERLVAVARLFAFNGVMYYLNNQMNFLVLEKVDTLTHGIINCGRRVANILFAIMWFGNKVTFFNGTGISLALAGGFLYVRAKMADAKAKAA